MGPDTLSMFGFYDPYLYNLVNNVNFLLTGHVV